MIIGVSSTDEVTHRVVGDRDRDRAVAGTCGCYRGGGNAPAPWAPGRKNHVLAVPAEDVTGRRITSGAALGADEASWVWWG